MHLSPHLPPPSTPRADGGPGPQQHQGPQLPLTLPQSEEARRGASFSLETSDLADTLDLSEGGIPLFHAVDEDLGVYRDTLPVVSESEEEEPASASGLYDDHSAEQPQDRSPMQPRTGHQRSSSAPAKPLKSALAKSPPRSPPNERESALPRKKKIRFEDDPSGSDLSLRRRATAPDDVYGNTVGIPFSYSSHWFADQSEWSVDDDGSGQSYGERGFLAYKGLSETRNVLDEEADDAAAELAEDAFAAELEAFGRAGAGSDVELDALSAEDVALRDVDEVSSRMSDGDLDQDRDDAGEDDFVDRTSATSEEHSDDDNLSGAREEAPQESGVLFLSEMERFEGEDNGPIALPTDQQEDDTGSESMHLPVIGETEVLATGPAARHKPQLSQVLRPRRLSDPYLHTRHESLVMGPRRRASSMTDFRQLKGPPRLHPLKASPAECAVTACSVRAAEQPRVNTVYQHPAARFKPDVREKKLVQTIQTVRSGSSTYQVLWEEPSRSSSESDVTVFEEPIAPVQELHNPSLVAHASRTPSPMRKVKSKLAAWSWAREQDLDDDGELRFNPLMAVDESDASSYTRRSFSSAVAEYPLAEYPPAPPNTGKTSGASSVRHSSLPHTPYDEVGEDDFLGDDEEGAFQDDEDVDTPVELRFRSSLSRSRSANASAPPDYLDAPGQSRSLPASPGARWLPRYLSNLEAEEERFRGHRDSVDLYHDPDREERQGSFNQLLMATRDSFMLAKLKYETKVPRNSGSGSAIQYSRFGGLSPIPASPQDSRGSVGGVGASKLSGEVGCASGEASPDKSAEGGDCSTEVE
ncbi:hypothetical protein LTR08_005496 [Meristemomyces frigidus]|nr:hypothetical protein LTR08_005496 [Meristemomyces frigidus]